MPYQVPSIPLSWERFLKFIDQIPSSHAKTNDVEPLVEVDFVVANQFVRGSGGRTVVFDGILWIGLAGGSIEGDADLRRSRSPTTVVTGQERPTNDLALGIVCY